MKEFVKEYNELPTELSQKGRHEFIAEKMMFIYVEGHNLMKDKLGRETTRVEELEKENAQLKEERDRLFKDKVSNAAHLKGVADIMRTKHPDAWREVCVFMGFGEKPLYEHDCDSCVYLGRHTTVNEHPFPSATVEWDLYYCKSEPTVIARHSSEPSEYRSGLEIAKVCKVLGEAKRRAIGFDLIKEDA